jgi:hypothetical protein
MDQPNLSTVVEAYKKYRALLELEKTSGTRTTRARNTLLQSLSDPDLMEIALKIKEGRDE